MPSRCNVYQCKECRTIIADSSYLTGRDEELGMISFQSKMCGLTPDTPNVISVNHKIYTSLKGKDRFCTFQYISCKQCSNTLGRLYYGTTPNLDFLRNAFAFNFDSIISYEVGFNRNTPTEINAPPIPANSSSEENDEYLEKGDQMHHILASAARRLSLTGRQSNKENVYKTPQRSNNPTNLR
ncbi:hypothetical protein HZS_7590 [Henneguya salminicola]|uniref:Protein Mis18-beta (Trinotate prediction) n=1 Tax=Henneguya salminicola TaxID=69463 RepID=A0A6G3MJF8_HENSL|nr:hypothetical protein HZS_7590 [Henneguya salminicola]